METPATWAPVPGEPAQDFDSAIHLAEKVGAIVRERTASMRDGIPVAVDEDGKTIFLVIDEGPLPLVADGVGRQVLDEVPWATRKSNTLSDLIGSTDAQEGTQ